MTRRATPRRAGTGGVSHGFGLGLTPCDGRPADPPPEVRRGQQQQRYRSHERGALRDREKVCLRPTRSGPACAHPGIPVAHKCNPSSVPAAPSTAPYTHELHPFGTPRSGRPAPVAPLPPWGVPKVSDFRWPLTTLRVACGSGAPANRGRLPTIPPGAGIFRACGAKAAEPASVYSWWTTDRGS